MKKDRYRFSVERDTQNNWGITVTYSAPHLQAPQQVRIHYHQISAFVSHLRRAQEDLKTIRKQVTYKQTL